MAGAAAGPRRPVGPRAGAGAGAQLVHPAAPRRPRGRRPATSGSSSCSGAAASGRTGSPATASTASSPGSGRWTACSPRWWRAGGGERALTDLEHLAELLHVETGRRARHPPPLPTGSSSAWWSPRPTTRRVPGAASTPTRPRCRSRRCTPARAWSTPSCWSRSRRGSSPAGPWSPTTTTVAAGSTPPRRSGWCADELDQRARRDHEHRQVVGDDLRLLYVALTRARHHLVVWWAPTLPGQLLRPRTGAVRPPRRRTGRHRRRGPVAGRRRVRGRAGRAGGGGPRLDRGPRPARGAGPRPGRRPVQRAGPGPGRGLPRATRGRPGVATLVVHVAGPVPPGSAPEGLGPVRGGVDEPRPEGDRALGAPSPGPASGTVAGRVRRAPGRRRPRRRGALRARGARPHRPGPARCRPGRGGGGARPRRRWARRRPRGAHPRPSWAPWARPSTRCCPGISLADLAPSDRLAELRFDLRLSDGRAGVPAGELGRVAAELAGPDDPFAGYFATLADTLGRRRVSGHLHGSIDAVLRVAGPSGPRFVVVDYKTNRLTGPTGEPGGRPPYGRAALVEAMAEHHYPLQALLYLVAVHRYLRWRLPGYDPGRHLGWRRLPLPAGDDRSGHPRPRRGPRRRARLDARRRGRRSASTGCWRGRGDSRAAHRPRCRPAGAGRRLGRGRPPRPTDRQLAGLLARRARVDDRDGAARRRPRGARPPTGPRRGRPPPRPRRGGARRRRSARGGRLRPPGAPGGRRARRDPLARR